MYDGELHRLGTFQGDTEEFNKLYKILKPLIRKLVKDINPIRYGVTKDILESYFYDKLMFTFTKYQENEFEVVKANCITSLKSYRNRVLRYGYTQKAESDMLCSSLDDLFDNKKEDKSNNEEDDYDDYYDFEYMGQEDKKNELRKKLIKLLKEKGLTEDEIFIYKIEMDPPEYFRNYNGRYKITTQGIVEYLEMPLDNKSMAIIGKARRKIKKTLNEIIENKKSLA